MDDNTISEAIRELRSSDRRSRIHDVGTGRSRRDVPRYRTDQSRRISQQDDARSQRSATQAGCVLGATGCSRVAIDRTDSRPGRGGAIGPATDPKSSVITQACLRAHEWRILIGAIVAAGLIVGVWYGMALA